MKLNFLIIGLYVITHLANGSDIQTSSINYCDYIDCKIYAQDDKVQFLGVTSQDKYYDESIIDTYGDYGSKYSQTSIRNTYSIYGSNLSNYSSYNDNAQKPPILYKLNTFTEEWEIVAYITKNVNLTTGFYPKLDPDILIITLESINCLLPPVNYCDYVDCKIYSQDDKVQFLGVTSQDKYDDESIIDISGDYGDKYSQTSIRNTFSIYGSELSNYSSYNDNAQNPPILYKLNTFTQEWEIVAYITKNTHLITGIYPKLDPDILIITLESVNCLPTPINYPPVFMSTAVTLATLGIQYSYSIETADINGNDMIITAPAKPEWLSLIDYGNGTALLSGTPNSSHEGNNNVKLRVSDGIISVDQDFIISVLGTNNIDEDFSLNFQMYPNPVSKQLNILISNQNIKNVLIKVYDITGQEKIFKGIKINLHYEIITISMENLKNGIYILEIKMDNENYRKLLIKD